MLPVTTRLEDQKMMTINRCRDNRDSSNLFQIDILRIATGMFLVCFSTDKFAPYRHTLYLLVHSELFKFRNFVIDNDF